MMNNTQQALRVVDHGTTAKRKKMFSCNARHTYMVSSMSRDHIRTDVLEPVKIRPPILMFVSIPHGSIRQVFTVSEEIDGEFKFWNR